VKTELLDETLLLKPIDGVALTLSMGDAKKYMIKKEVTVFSPDDPEDVCSTALKYAQFWRTALNLRGERFGWCDEEDFSARYLAGTKGKYAVVVECADVTADPERTSGSGFAPLGHVLPLVFYAVLCKAYVVRAKSLEELMEWVPAR